MWIGSVAHSIAVSGPRQAVWYFLASFRKCRNSAPQYDAISLTFLPFYRSCSCYCVLNNLGIWYCVFHMLCDGGRARRYRNEKHFDQQNIRILEIWTVLITFHVLAFVIPRLMMSNLFSENWRIASGMRIQGFTNPRRQVARATKFRTASSSISGS